MTILDDIGATLTDALVAASVPRPITIIRTTPGAPDPAEPGEIQSPMVATYDALGWEEAFDAGMIDGTVIRSTDLRIVVLLSTIAKAAGAPGGAPATVTPAALDTVASRGKSYSVIVAAIDTTGAIVRMQCRA